MNTNEAVEAIIALQKKSISYLVDSITYKTAIAEILEELLDTGIADTKRVCLESIEPFSRFAHMHHSAYVEAIEGAEIKEQEK